MTMSAREKTSNSAATPADHEIEWSAEEELQLFFALKGLKPVGVNKHFYMMCIIERLSKSLNRDVTGEAIWAHLRTMYNLDKLDRAEPLPFPNEVTEFELPDPEFSALLSKKRAESEEKRSSSTDGPPSIIAVATDYTGRDKLNTINKTTTNQQTKEIEKKTAAKVVEPPKRGAKRTRNSLSSEIQSPSTTPPPVHNAKRRRI